jgi:phospholipase/carboxylesterase
MKEALNLFEHVYIDNKASRTLFLFHGTGGSPNDFLFLNDSLKEKYNLVALKGNVSEMGRSRFFKRMAEGVFDQENIKEEAEKLRQFIEAWQTTYSISREELFLLGYSNGANIVLATLFYFPELFSNAILLHAMLPFQIEEESLALAGHSIYVTVGTQDEVIPETERTVLLKTLEQTGAKLTIKEYESGHEVRDKEISDMIGYLLYESS